MHFKLAYLLKAHVSSNICNTNLCLVLELALKVTKKFGGKQYQSLYFCFIQYN